MTSATIKRQQRKPGSGGTATARRPSRRSARTKGRLDRLIDMLPFSQATLQRGLTWGVALFAITLLWVAARFLGLPAMVEREFADLAAKAGFEVARIEVRGVERMDEMPVYTLALAAKDRSMLSVELDELRSRILTLGWIKEARITRRLPDTLVIDIVERQPVAVWQNRGQLMLVDGEGVVLEAVAGPVLPDLPLVVGPGANERIDDMQRLLEAAPALRPLLTGATWVGNRRWDLTFQSGETLLLPESEPLAAAALAKFAQLDGVNRLLGRGIVRFDMRDPSRFVLRLPPQDQREAARATDDGAPDGGALPEGEAASDTDGAEASVPAPERRA